MKFACPCCNNLTFDKLPNGNFDICPVCYWEDDNVQNLDPNYRGDANRVSLNIARRNYKERAVSDLRYAGKVRPPLEDELPECPIK